MATTGSAVVDFGTGKRDTSVAVTGQTGILAGSRASAWIEATASADHTVDEHWLEDIQLVCGSVTSGVGFTIYAVSGTSALYGTYNCGWAWV